MTSDEQRDSLAEQAAAWVPPWARERPAEPEASVEPAEPFAEPPERAVEGAAPPAEPPERAVEGAAPPAEPPERAVEGAAPPVEPAERAPGALDEAPASSREDAPPAGPEPAAGAAAAPTRNAGAAEGPGPGVHAPDGPGVRAPDGPGPGIGRASEFAGAPAEAGTAEPVEAAPAAAEAAPPVDGPAAAAPAAPVRGRGDALALLDDDELRGALEAILLVVDEPVAEIVLAQILEQPTERVTAALRQLSADYTAAGHGFDLRRAAGGWRLYTRPEYAGYVERFILDGQSVRLTQAALETLAVIAYKQPVTRGRISAIRGVNCDGVVRTLLSRNLIEECGTEPDSGAYLYRTTTLFLEKLGLDRLEELPPLAPFLPDNVEELTDAPQ